MEGCDTLRALLPLPLLPAPLFGAGELCPSAPPPPPPAPRLGAALGPFGLCGTGTASSGMSLRACQSICSGLYALLFERARGARDRRSLVDPASSPGAVTASPVRGGHAMGVRVRTNLWSLCIFSCLSTPCDASASRLALGGRSDMRRVVLANHGSRGCCSCAQTGPGSVLRELGHGFAWKPPHTEHTGWQRMAAATHGRGLKGIHHSARPSLLSVDEAANLPIMTVIPSTLQNRARQLCP